MAQGIARAHDEVLGVADAGERYAAQAAVVQMINADVAAAFVCEQCDFAVGGDEEGAGAARQRFFINQARRRVGVAQVVVAQLAADGKQAGVEPASGVAVSRVWCNEGLDGIGRGLIDEVPTALLVNVNVGLSAIVNVGLHQRCSERGLPHDFFLLNAPVHSEVLTVGSGRAEEQVPVIRTDGGSAEVVPAGGQRVAGLVLPARKVVVEGRCVIKYPELLRERTVQPALDMAVTCEQALFAALAVNQGQAVIAGGNKPSAVAVVLQTGYGVGDALLTFAVVGKIVYGDGVAAVAVCEQSVGFVDGEVACRGFEVKQAGLLQAVHVNDGEPGRGFVTDKGIARRGIHVEECLHDRFRSEAFTVLVGEVERGSAGEGGKEEQGFSLFHGGQCSRLIRGCSLLDRAVATFVVLQRRKRFYHPPGTSPLPDFAAASRQKRL